MQQRPKHTNPMTKSVLLLLVFAIVSPMVIRSQPLPPARSDGFVYSTNEVDSDAVVIEAFLDPVCSDSRDAWEPLVSAVDHYGSRVVLVVHLFPLPYHDNAYVTSRAIHIVNLRNSNDTFRLLEGFFEHQDRFSNARTNHLSRSVVLDEITDFVAETLGKSYHATIESGFDDKSTDLLTRVSFKYSASRGVYGTPFFYVNGFLLPNPGFAIDFRGWRRVLDPLISTSLYEKAEDTLHFFL